MAVTDSIADFLTRVRNAQKAHHIYVDIPASNMKRSMCKILIDKGYCSRYIDIMDGKQGGLRLYLKYDSYRRPVIHSLKRVSKPGRRVYVAVGNIPHSMNGLGINILSTSKGVMTDKEARVLRVGGELLCSIT